MGLLCSLIICLAVATSAAEPTAPVPETSIPVAVFFKNPTISHPRLSPNGNHIAFVYAEEDSQRVFVREVVGSEVEGLVEFPMGEVRLVSLEWANSNRLLLSGMASNPKAKTVEPLRTRWYGINRVRPRLKWLGEKWPDRGPDWPAWQVRFADKVISLLPDDRENVLISHLEFGQRTPSVSMLNVNYGRLRQRHAATLGIDKWHVDRAGNVRAAEASGQSWDGKSYALLARTKASQKLEPVFESEDYWKSNYRFAGFHDVANQIYVIADHMGRDALYEFDIDTKTLGDLVFAHPEVDVAGAHYSVARQKVVGASFVLDEPEVAFFDADAKREQRSIDHSMLAVQSSKTINRIVSSTSDGNLTIIEVGSHVQPSIFYAYDRSKKQINFIFEQRPGIPVDQLAEVKRINFAAHDATSIPGYLTLPRDREPARLPMIVLPHDGPASRDAMVYNPVVQFFANRGYAVLQVNYRGSSGFGQNFRLAGNREWGRAIQEDIADGVRWAIREGIVDPERIGIYGTGYGGYSALMGLVTSPELYRAGASFAGITDLELLTQEDGNFLWEMELHEKLLGGTDGDSEGLRRNSPIHRVKDIRAPVLLGHGAKDSRVGVEHARKLNRVLEAAGKNVKYWEYADEFEGFVLESSRIDFYTQLLKFFDTHLGAGASQ